MALRGASADPTAVWRAAALVLIGTLLLSGVAVLIRYHPTPDGAHDAVRGLPPVVRALHHWSGAAVLVAAVAFAARAWLRGAERERRYPAWAAVLVALAVAHAAFLGGRILAWDQHGWESYAHLVLALRVIGLAGPHALEPDRARLLWTFVVHIAIGVVAIGGLALLWRRHDGRSWPAFLHRVLVKPWTERRARRVALGVLLVLVLLAVFMPPTLGPPPSDARGQAAPDWPFLWLAPVESVGGALAVWLVALAVAGLLALAPLAAAAGPTTRRVLAAAMATAWLSLTVWGWIGP